MRAAIFNRRQQLPESPEKDPALTLLIEAWPTLPEHVRATIRMLVDSVKPTRPL